MLVEMYQRHFGLTFEKDGGKIALLTDALLRAHTYILLFLRVVMYQVNTNEEKLTFDERGRDKIRYGLQCPIAARRSFFPPAQPMYHNESAIPTLKHTQPQTRI